MTYLTHRHNVNVVLKKIWAEIDRLSEEFMKTGRPDIYVTMEGLKKQAIRIMELQKEREANHVETEEEYADRKFDEEIAFLEKYGNLTVVSK